MKLHKNIRPELVASKSRYRIALSEPWLEIPADGKPAQLIATNGNALVAIPVDVAPTDHAGYVSGEALKAARKLAPKTGEAEIGLNGCASLTNGATLPRAEANVQNCTPPNWRRLVPSDETPRVISFGLDTKLLNDLAAAMGTDRIRLEIIRADGAMIARPIAACSGGCGVDPAGPVGLLMPIRLG